MKDETLQKRMEEVPKAKTIIAEYITEFIEWCEMRKNVPYIKAAKQKLHDMQKSELYQSMYEHYTSNVSKSIEQNSIEKVIKNMALKMQTFSFSFENPLVFSFVVERVHRGIRLGNTGLMCVVCRNPQI